MFIKTEAVDKLCVPFGLIIGPCTIISNLIKIVADVAKLIFYGLLTINYKSSEEFKKFKEADLDWETHISSECKPHANEHGNLTIFYGTFTNPEELALVNAMGTSHFINFLKTYKALSAQDRRRISFEWTQKDLIQHWTFIGIGIIRSIPVIGGSARWAYQAAKAC